MGIYRVRMGEPETFIARYPWIRPRGRWIGILRNVRSGVGNCGIDWHSVSLLPAIRVEAERTWRTLGDLGRCRNIDFTFDGYVFARMEGFATGEHGVGSELVGAHAFLLCSS